MKSVFLDSFINRHFWLSYARIRVIFTASSKADDIVRLTRITAETYKPKFHCRRQSGMNFGYVTENGVNSNNLITVFTCRYSRNGGRIYGTENV